MSLFAPALIWFFCVVDAAWLLWRCDVRINDKPPPVYGWLVLLALLTLLIERVADLLAEFLLMIVSLF